MAEFILSLGALWLGTLFAYAGSAKLLSPLEYRVRTVSAYKLLPPRLGRYVAISLPYAEVLCGGAILLTPHNGIGLVAAAVLGTIFLFATGTALARGLRLDCGCTGSGSDPVRPSTLLRAMLIVIAAGATLMAGTVLPVALGVPGFAVALAPACWVALNRRRQHADLDRQHSMHEHHQHAVAIGQ